MFQPTTTPQQAPGGFIGGSFGLHHGSHVGQPPVYDGGAPVPFGGVQGLQSLQQQQQQLPPQQNSTTKVRKLAHPHTRPLGSSWSFFIRRSRWSRRVLYSSTSIQDGRSSTVTFTQMEECSSSLKLTHLQKKKWLYWIIQVQFNYPFLLSLSCWPDKLNTKRWNETAVARLSDEIICIEHQGGEKTQINAFNSSSVKEWLHSIKEVINNLSMVRYRQQKQNSVFHKSLTTPTSPICSTEHVSSGYSIQLWEHYALSRPICSSCLF